MSKRFVSIYFENLAIDWFIIRESSLRAVPFVLTITSHGRKLITATNHHARAHGALPGMVLADARALVPALQHFDHPPQLEERLLQKLGEFCIRYTPTVAVNPPDGLLFDASGCAHLWGGEEKYVAAILERLRKRGYRVRATLSDTVGSAWAVARFGNTPVVPTNEHRQALLNLPPAALRLASDTIDLLEKLGLRQISQFIGIARPALRRRFGPLLLQRLDEALGAIDEVIVPVYTPAPFEERLPTLEPVPTRPGIEIALRQLIDALCKRLQQEAKGLREANFICYRIDGKVVSISIGTNRPSANPKHLYPLFQLKIDQLEPALGIELFVLRATKVNDLVPAQTNLWEEQSGWDDTKLSELMDRIAGKVGTASIQRFLPAAHYWPERSFRPARSMDEVTTTEWKADRPRPLRLFAKPEPIQVTAPIPDYPPMNFRYKGVLHKITHAEGPERIEQEWWLQEGEHRDYYAVENEQGGRYWLFRSGHYQQERKLQWFIHGIFA